MLAPKHIGVKIPGSFNGTKTGPQKTFILCPDQHFRQQNFVGGQLIWLGGWGP